MEETRYRELAVPLSLRPWVECAWELRVGRVAGDYAHRVLPDGCIDVVWSPRLGAEVVGTSSSAFLAPMPPGSVGAGVRFRVGCAAPVVGVPAEALLDARIAPGALWGDAGRRLEDTLDHADSGEARLCALMTWLERRARGAPMPDPVVRAAACRLAAAPNTGIADLAGALAVSERHLRRRVAGEVGYGPKRLARVFRLHNALAVARTGPAAGLADAAYEAGYSDQAHFANECVALAGVPPSLLLTGVRSGA